VHRQEHAARDQAGERDGRLTALLGAAQEIFEDVRTVGRRFVGDAREGIMRPAAQARAFPGGIMRACAVLLVGLLVIEQQTAPRMVTRSGMCGAAVRGVRLPQQRWVPK
jgi:hypothetical protein